jgi:hypothetical protein
MRARLLSRLAPPLAAAAALASGCQSMDDASAVVDRATLVNDLASRLDGSGQLTYSADYQLSGGRAATIAQAQEPLRSAYIYPGGKVTVTSEATTACRAEGAATRCTVTPPPSPANKPAVTLFEDAGAQGLVAPTVVVSLLTAAALDPDAVVAQSDTTVAGRHATCVQVERVQNAAASEFGACITTEGVLGSFEGVVNGAAVDIALTRYRDAVDATAFATPAGATVVDHRPGS